MRALHLTILSLLTFCVIGVADAQMIRRPHNFNHRHHIIHKHFKNFKKQ